MRLWAAMQYKTIYAPSQDSFIERKSEFIGYIAPVKTNDEAVEFINSIRAMHRKATHCVYAYVLRDGNISRYSDDGEPQGTAGTPVLDVILKEGLTDVCVVAVRYFGGILLGGGGLVRAYSHTAKIAVDSAEIMLMCQCSEVTVVCDYSLYGKISYLLPEFEVKMLESSFSDSVCLKMLVKSEKINPLTEKLTDAANGRISIDISDTIYADFA